MSETEDLKAELVAAREEIARLTHALAEAQRTRDVANKTLEHVMAELEIRAARKKGKAS